MNSQIKTSTCLSVIWLYDGKVAQNMKIFSLRPVVPGCAGCPMAHPDFGRSVLTLFQPGGTDYAHRITTGTPGFSDLPTALHCTFRGYYQYLCLAN